VYDKPVIDPKYGDSHARLAYVDMRRYSFFASENDMNILIRGVRFSMRVGRTDCVKNILEPKAESTDTKDFFYMGDADPDRVRTMHHSQPTPLAHCLPNTNADLPPRGIVDHGRGN
jgi:choline dehydrogenase